MLICVELKIGRVQVRVMVQGCETVLGDAASDHELFMTAEVLTRCEDCKQAMPCGECTEMKVITVAMHALPPVMQTATP